MKQHVLDERYRIIELAGRGGMACVYRADDLKTGDTVAIKVLPPQMASRAFYSRFKREFKTCSQLHHPNIIGLRDLGQIEDGGLYYAMEFLPWPDLEDIIAKNIEAKRHCEEKFVFSLIEQMVSAFAYYHKEGVVHRDLKPANVMVSPEGKVVITDFGLALDINSTRLTATGTIVGSPLYMSPELISASTSDFRSDYYQLGVIVFNLLTSQLPFNAPDIPTLALKIMQQKAPSVRKFNENLREDWDGFLSRCMAKKPAQRFQCAKDMERALSWLKAGNYKERIDSLFPYVKVAKEQTERARELQKKQSRPFSSILAIFLFLLLFFWFSRFNEMATSFSVANVKTSSSCHSIEMRWQSAKAYPSRLFVHGLGLIEGSDDEVKEHRIVVGGLEAGKSYRCAVVFPNGGRSLEKKVTTQRVNRRLLSAKVRPPNLEFSFACDNGQSCHFNSQDGDITPALKQKGQFIVKIPQVLPIDERAKVIFDVEGHRHEYLLSTLLLERANELIKNLSKFSAEKTVDGILAIIAPGSELVLKTMSTLKQDGSEVRDKASKIPPARKLLLKRLEEKQIYHRLSQVKQLLPLLRPPLLEHSLCRRLQLPLTEMLSVHLFASFEGINLKKPPTLALEQWQLSPSALSGNIEEIVLLDRMKDTLKMGLYYPVTNLHGKLKWEKSFSIANPSSYKEAELAMTTGPSAEICLRITINGNTEMLFYDPRPLAINQSMGFGETLFQRIPIACLEKQNKLILKVDTLFRRFTRNQVLLSKITLRLRRK